MHAIEKNEMGLQPPALIILERNELPVLSQSESEELASLESVIAKGIRAFLETGRALKVIKAKRLYRGKFATFEAYCTAKWALKRSHAYRLVDAAEVYAHLSPIGDIPLPQNECQVRPLVGLSPQLAKRAWAMAVETAGNRVPSGAMVRRAVLAVSSKLSSKASDQESWQRLTLPLLRSAVKSVQLGNRDDVEEALHRALLRLEVGSRPAFRE